MSLLLAIGNSAVQISYLIFFLIAGIIIIVFLILIIGSQKEDRDINPCAW